MKIVKWSLLSLLVMVVLFLGLGTYLSGQSKKPVITATVGDSTLLISGKITSSSISNVEGGSRWVINNRHTIELIQGALSVNGVPMGRGFREARVDIPEGKPLTSTVEWQLP